MDNITFYKDSPSLFEVEVKIEGASLNESKARLLLEFDNEHTLLFNGTINSGGICKVTIPALKEIKKSSGRAILEIIADDTYFEPWKSQFDIQNKKSIKLVSEATISSVANNKKIVVNVQPTKKSVLTESKKEKKLLDGILKETCSPEDRHRIKTVLSNFTKLQKNKKERLMKELKQYDPELTTVSWASKVFKDSSTMVAKYCMRLTEK